MKKPKALGFEAWYPTQGARHAADRVFDKLPLHTAIGEAIRLWELTYIDAGGVVRGPEPK